MLNATVISYDEVLQLCAIVFVALDPAGAAAQRKRAPRPPARPPAPSMAE